MQVCPVCTRDLPEKPRYSDTGEEYHNEECFIDKIPCRAEEGRFGGVIVQVIELPG